MSKQKRRATIPDSRTGDQTSPTASWKRWAPPLIVVVVTAIAFLPALSGDFAYDDQLNIQENLQFRGLAPANLKWMFTTFHLGHYQPLSWMTLACDYLIWGMNPFGYHLTNLLLHCANAVLVYLLAMLLIDAAARRRNATIEAGKLRLAAAVAALIFAIHPLRVESVAWVTERRDVLSSCLLLATILFYLRAHRSESRPAVSSWMPLCLSLFALSLLSRAMGVTLPVILLILDWYPLGRLLPLTRRIFVEKLPFIALALAAAVVAPIAQAHSGAAATIIGHPPIARLMQAAYGLVFYVYKSLLPIALVPIYELTIPLNPASPKYLASASLVLVLTIALIRQARRWRATTVAVLCYAVFLLPVLGFFQSGRQEVADRYSYLATIGFAILVAGWAINLRARRSLVLTLVTCFCLTMGAVTWIQCRVWKTSLSLWIHAVANGPPSSVAHHNLGCDMVAHQRWAEALVELEKSNKIDPGSYSTHYNIGRCQHELGRIDEAIAGYLEAVRLKPDYAVAHSNLGVAFTSQRRTDEAMKHIRRALEIQPDYPDAQCNLAVALAGAGQTDEAIAVLEQVVQAHPDHAKAHYNLARLLERRGETARAVQHYREMLRIDATDAQARRLLDTALKKLDDQPPNKQ
jgi:tetratricopeptide (TPR) repeat protein